MRRRSLAIVALLGLTGCAARSVVGSTAGTGATDAPLGLSVNVHMGPTLLSDDYDEYSGVGVGASVGYGFGPRASIYAGIDVAALDVEDEFGASAGTADLTHLDLGLRYNFDKPGRRFVPYVFAAVGSRMVSSEVCDGGFGCFDVDMTGLGYTFGPGLRIFLGNSFGVDAGWALTFGEFTDATVDGESVPGFEGNTAVSGRLMLGAAWYPGRGGDGGGGGGGGGPIK